MTWLLIVSSLLLVSYLGVFIYKTKTGSPYLPSRDQEVKTILKYIPEKTKICDFGAGDGKVMLAIAKAKQVEVWGWEIEPLIWLVNKIRLRNETQLKGKLYYYFGDMWKVNFNQFDILIVYQLERFATKLAQKCLKEMKSGSLVIANTYPIKGLKKIKQDGKIIVYQI